MAEQIKLKDVLIKKAFTRITPFGYGQGAISILPEDGGNDKPQWKIVTQADFLREYYPDGHLINDPVYYPDKISIDPDTKKPYMEKVFRCNFPFQKIITTKQLIHLCGNDIRLEITEPKESDSTKADFFTFKKGWQMKHTERAWYELAKSVKVTGDGALAGYMNNGVFGWRNFSYMTGDKLYPQYDELNRLKLFAREYNSYDEEGKAVTSFVEIWDKTNHSVYKKPLRGVKASVISVLEVFGLTGYVNVSSKAHGFDNIPIIYHRNDDGACWSDSQDSCDKYEIAVSHLCQNNLAYAFPILFLKGESVTIAGSDDIYRPVKAITGDKDSMANFLNTPDGSSSFELQLKILLNNIFMGSFTVLPPELKSGDLPGVAVKLLYSPAIEKAMADAAEFDQAIDDMVKIFAHGYGMEIDRMTAFKNLPINSWIEPYVHQNVAELMNNLALGVQNGFVSKETASDWTPYSKNDENYRLIKQMKEQQQADLLTDFNPNTPPVVTE